MASSRTYSPVAVDAAKLLGARIRVARSERRWTLEELSERVGVSVKTMRKIERGDLGVGIGLVFEAAAVLGVALFHGDAARRSLEHGRVDDRLALLPRRVRKPVKVDNDF